ncbi:biosynthetic-type acetolactate synthase large subunit [Deinococcus cellulosilyticus]|uniref:Acetolactate synthase n=1 Tax=Deinococcus cellulosilyticus (strain DSM 18568 / NBRC 106333 / KACC 11606 / 5516J-15) TaxID=1223518 RepID=A0A511MYL5_DEIC1|nr:biosynthetic-type acetolactate synthase large subunit [Deinococcus cellulosilyticus]GEM45659.1 acetolactate synthase [Deinococcus cellulosilyticus NBRC 106333 = KACC 11606]
MTQTMTGAELLLHTLREHGITTLFGIPGAMNLPIYDALGKFGMRHILTRHEQGAVHAAEGFARSSKQVGVCLATSGPAATNLITGLGDALLDHVSVLALTGNVPTHLQGTRAFQELDIVSIARPVTKGAFQVRSASQIPGIVREALHLAQSGKPGPVLIDLPQDIQTQRVQVNPRFLAEPPLSSRTDPEAFRQVMKALKSASRPVLLLGGGAQDARDVRSFVETTGLPVVHTLQGIGILPANHPQRIGMPGVYGSARANQTISEADLILGIGVRFDDRLTGKLALFAPQARILHIDLDPLEFGRLIQPELSIQARSEDTFEALCVFAEPLNLAAWWSRIQGFTEQQAPSRWSMAFALQALSQVLDPFDILTTDVGHHQMLAAHHCPPSRPRHWLTSGGLGTMGYALPAAAGAAIAKPDQRVICICGDGGFQMTHQELSTVVAHNLNVKILVLDNGHLGMVRQYQDLFTRAGRSEVELTSSNPDFTRLAQAYQIPAWKVQDQMDLPHALQLWLNQPGPALLHAQVPAEENIPVVPAGQHLTQLMVQKAQQNILL